MNQDNTQGENEEMKREISEIEAKRVEQHQEMTDDQVIMTMITYDNNDDNDDRYPILHNMK